MSLITVILGVVAGVCAGFSGAFQLKKPHPGWFIATCLAIWLILLYSGTWTV